MSLKERTYSILVVSSTDSFASAFIGSLPEIRYYPVLTASSVSAAKRMLKEKSFDFVIINSPLSDDIGVRFAIDLCSSRQIIFTHALKNAWFPVLNYIGPASAFLLTGSFAIESVFTIPGLGREFVMSIANRDYTLILGLTVFMGTVVILLNLLTDLLGAWLDPSVRRAYRKK